MSTQFYGEGNIGSDPEVRMFPSANNQPPRGLLRLNVRFDNPVPTDIGPVDKGGFWANVEIWHKEVEKWAKLYQRGMRVMVSGRLLLDEWDDRDTGQKRSQFKINGLRVGILPYRIEQVVLSPATGSNASVAEANVPTTENRFQDSYYQGTPPQLYPSE